MKIQRDLDETKIILVSVMYLNLLLLTYFQFTEYVSCIKYCWINVHCYNITYTFEYFLLQNFHFSCSLLLLALYI
jgi:hypothetical protein